MIFVDSNVLIDVLGDDPVWGDWSRLQLVVAAGTGEVAINNVVYAELAAGHNDIEDLDRTVSHLGLLLVPIPRIALFVAGKAFLRYRRAGGARTGVLPDFFLGAQALVAGATLITRDTRRYRTYFPGLPLIAPAFN